MYNGNFFYAYRVSFPGSYRDFLCEEAKSLPHLRDHQKVDPESLKQYLPEVIFTSTVIQETLAKSMKAVGLPVIHQDPRTLEQIYESIRAIAMVVGREPQAKELIAAM